MNNPDNEEPIITTETIDVSVSADGEIINDVSIDLVLANGEPHDVILDGESLGEDAAKQLWRLLYAETS